MNWTASAALFLIALLITYGVLHDRDGKDPR
jgi:hypothetical protein